MQRLWITSKPIQHNANLIARVDCLQSFARVAIKNNYCKPEINDSFIIDIKDGRHPVIEQHLELGESYVPNDVYLDNENQQILMITGPNMAGKSAVLRQTALICLMAQMGCYVPAQTASIGLIDKVFTRVGASDNISSGESTFMVEMNETASIMNNISDRSLILLDEIGRGTSTYDGISIAWSIAEFLHDNKNFRPKTLFATHYHELNELANKFPRIKNYNIAHKGDRTKGYLFCGSWWLVEVTIVLESMSPRWLECLSVLSNGPIIFLKNWNKKSIEQNGNAASKEEIKDTLQSLPADSNLQLSIFETVDPVAGKLKEKLLDVEVNNMTPIECMMKLNELKQLLEED